MVFAEFERESLRKLDELIYSEHLATMTALTEDAFKEEREQARDVYSRLGKRMAPWLQWTPRRTAADAWLAAQERRKDPEYMARIHQLQRDLDERADTIKKAVETELEVRKAAQKDREERKLTDKRSVGRHYAHRVPWRSRTLR